MNRREKGGPQEDVRRKREAKEIRINVLFFFVGSRSRTLGSQAPEMLLLAVYNKSRPDGHERRPSEIFAAVLRRCHTAELRLTRADDQLARGVRDKTQTRIAVV